MHARRAHPWLIPTAALLTVAALLIAGVFGVSAYRTSLWRKCHALQKYTLESHKAFSKCMRDSGLDPKDWMR